MKIMRKFNLIGGKCDYQFVSMLDNAGHIAGYSKHEKYALDLNDKQAKIVKDEFSFVRAEYMVI
jgi:hypothetical protein